MKINLAKLADDLSRLKFRVQPEELGFNDNEQTSLLFTNNIDVEVEVQKFSDKYFIKVKVKTLAHYSCDRCLDDFDKPFKTTFQLIYSNLYPKL